jgi:hypothetical protein
MDFLRDIVLIAHLLGMAAILGPWLGGLRATSKRVTSVMVWGARAQIVTGVLLVGLAYAGDGEPHHWKFALKLLLALAVVGAAESNAKKTASVERAWWFIGVVALAAVTVAVMWR